MEATLQNNNQTQVNVNCLKEQNKATRRGGPWLMLNAKYHASVDQC